MNEQLNNKVPLKAEYVIQALQEENYLLREQNVTLRGTLFQVQAEAQEQITNLRRQLAKAQTNEGDSTPAVPPPTR